MANKSFNRMESTCLEDEIDFLSAVFFEELQISEENTDKNEKILFLNLEPSTADDKTKQFVFVKLKVIVPIDYPNVSPIWSTLNSRGLSDEILNSLLTEARFVSQGKVGHSMLYEVIEHLKVFLTQQNRPSEACCVCMCEFDLDQEYTKTNCFHFFHLSCFSSFVSLELQSIHSKETEEQVAGLKKEKFNLECPVCRLVIPNDSQCIEDIQEINPMSFFNSQNEVFIPSLEMREQQEMWKGMYARQQAAGGIIDLKEEAAKFDMDSDWKPPTPEDGTGTETIEVSEPELIVDKPNSGSELVFSACQESKDISIECKHIPSVPIEQQTTTIHSSPKRITPKDKQQQQPQQQQGEYVSRSKYYNRRERGEYENYSNYRGKSNQTYYEYYDYDSEYKQHSRQAYRGERGGYYTGQHDARPQDSRGKARSYYQSRY